MAKLTEEQKKQFIKEWDKLSRKYRKPKTASKPKKNQKIVKTCIICGTEYTPNWRTKTRQKYCSNECYMIAQRKRDKQKREAKKVYDFCKWCKKKFLMKSPQQKFDSDKCRIRFLAVRDRIQNLYPFDESKTQKELEKLRKLGKNYRFEDEKLNIFYNLKGGEK